MRFNGGDVKLLVALILIGAASGIGIGSLALTKYHAVKQLDAFIQTPRDNKTRLKDGEQRSTIEASQRADIGLYRRVMQELSSTAAFRQFAKDRSASEAIETLEKRLGDGESRWLKFEYNFGLEKSDLRDLPDSVAREYGTQFVKDGIGSGSRITAIDPERGVAHDMVELLADYMSDTALRLQMKEQAKVWAVDGTVQIAVLQSDIAKAHSGLESLDRRLAGMKPLRDSIQADNGPTKLEGGVQVQVAGARYLSASQQFTALEAQKVDDGEELRQLQFALERAQIKKQLGDVVLPLALTTEPAKTSLEKILKAFASETEKLKTSFSGSQLNMQATMLDCNQILLALKTRYIDVMLDPAIVRRDGPPRLLTALVGILAGLAVFAIQHMLRSQRKLDVGN